MKSPALKPLALVLVAALAVRLAAGWWWQSRLEGPFLFGDSESYWELARCVAREEPYRFGQDGARVFRTPGYPVLLAPIFLVAGDRPPVLWGRALSAVLDSLSVAGVAWLAWRLFDARAGLLAATIAACYPGSIAVGALVLSEAPFCPLMLLQLGLWIAAWKAPSARTAGWLAGLAGLAAGLATLMRPSWLLFTPFAVAIGLAAGKPRRRHLAIGAAMLAGLVLAMTPWWIRNALVTGHFVPTTLQVGASLYDGWNPRATGASEMSFVERLADEERRRQAGPPGDQDAHPESQPAQTGTAADTLEYRLDRRLRDEALAWARHNPGRVVELAWIKLVRMWNLWPNEPSLSSWPMRLAIAATYVPVLLLALVGAVRTAHRGWPYVLCWLPAVYFSLLHTVFVSSIRYRQPAMLPLMVLAAGAAAEWWAGGSGRGAVSRGQRAESGRPFSRGTCAACFSAAGGGK